MSVNLRAEKFNIISNDHGRTNKWDFFVSYRKNLFWANLVLNFKTVSLSWNLVSRLVQICRIQMVIFTFFVSYQKSPFWANLVQKIKVSLTPSGSTPLLEAPFFGKFGPTNRNSQLKLKFGTLINSNMQNSMAVFIFFFFYIRNTLFTVSATARE